MKNKIIVHERDEETGKRYFRVTNCITAASVKQIRLATRKMEIIEGIRAEAEGLVALGQHFSRAFRDHNSKVTFLGTQMSIRVVDTTFFVYRPAIDSEFRETRQKFLNSPEVDLAELIKCSFHVVHFALIREFSLPFPCARQSTVTRST